MKTNDLISGLFVLCFGILLSAWSSSYQIGNLTQPGPGFLPLLLGILLCLFSIILLIQARRSSAQEKKKASLALPSGWKKMAYTVLVVLFAAFFFERVGYILAVFFMIGLLMVGTESRKLKKAFLTAFLTTLGVYIVFILLLEQPFPRGLLRF